LTLHAKVDSREQASFSLGVHDGQAEANRQALHGGVQSRDRETGEAKRSDDEEEKGEGISGHKSGLENS
jgi:hypothetical protein